MPLLLRLVLIGLTPLALVCAGWLLDAPAAALLALAVGATALTAWLFQRTLRADPAHQQAALLRALLEDAPVAIAIKDRQGRYLLANAALRRPYGLHEAQILGQTDAAIVSAEAAQSFQASDQDVLHRGQARTDRTLLQNPDGQWRQMETVKYPLRDAQGQVQALGFVAMDITELAAPQEKFARVFEASSDWIVIARLSDSVVVDANPGFERISGHARSAAIGRPLKELDIWAYPEQRTALVSDLLRDGVVRDRLAQMRRRDGEVRDLIVNATLITLYGQPNSHALWVARDVTEEHATNAQFAAAFRMTPDYMSISRLSDGRYVEVNEAFQRITGYHRDEVIGHTALELGIWHNAAQRQALVQAFAHASVVLDSPMQMRDRHGQLRDMRVNASIYEARGERYMIGLLRDVTESQRAEKALRESEARFYSLFDLSPLPMAFAFDSDNFTTYHRNQAWHDTFGFDRAASHGKTAIELHLWANPADANTFTQLLATRQDINHWVVQWICRDGTPLWISIFGRFIVEPGRTTLVLTYLDITSQRRAQQEVLELNTQLEARVLERTQALQNANLALSRTLQTLNQTKDHLVHSEKLAGLGALVAGVAHELNTPIGNGLTVASTLEHKTRDFAAAMALAPKRSTLEQFVTDTQFAADILLRNLTRAAAMVASFKQVAVDQTSSQRREFALQEVVGEIVITLNPAIRKSGCLVRPRIDAALTLDSYPGPLGQVLTNLLNNAMLHAFAPGHTDGTIDIEAEALDAHTAQLRVRDNGVGIEAIYLKRIFDPFFTTRLGTGGSGLGLHIVHNIVTGLLGGTVEVHSTPGQGTQFTLRLPRQAPAHRPVE